MPTRKRREDKRDKKRTEYYKRFYKGRGGTHKKRRTHKKYDKTDKWGTRTDWKYYY